MKAIFKTMWLSSLLLAFGLLNLHGQESKSQKFVVHEDQVHPNKVAAYEAATKKFAETMNEHNATDAAFLTVSLEDMRYLYVSAIDNMASLDHNPIAEVSEAMGEDEFSDMMSGYDDTFETHTNYIINLNHDLSYKSDVILNEGVNFRMFTYYFIDPDNWKEATAIAKEWQELHASKDAPHGYRIYTGGLGTEPMIMVVQWAKDAQEFYANQAENQMALGDPTDLRNRTMAVTRKMEHYTGMIRPDLSYQPKSAMADN